MFEKVSRYFVSNRKLSVLFFAGIVLWGSVSYVLTPKQYNPDIVAPAFLIRVEAPGMTGPEVYELVAKPLENLLHEIPGVEDIYSRSVHGGVSYVTVRFYVGEDLEKSMITLRQRIDSNLDLKPVGAGQPSIRAIDPEDLPVMTIAVTSAEKTPVELRRLAFRIKDELKMVPGTSIIEVIGGRRREFSVVLDSGKMRESKTDVADIEQALQKTSVLRALGPVKARDDWHGVELSSTVNSVKEIEELTVATNFERELKVSQLARVEEGTEEPEDETRLIFRDREIPEAVFISVAKQKGRNIVPLTRAVREKLKALEKEMPGLEGVELAVLRDEGQVAGNEISGLMVSLVQAIAIVFAILFMFLNWRAALIVAVSVPLTLLAVFGAGNLAGYTINRITLFALILSLGLLVDSATVVVENIVRHKRIDPDGEAETVIPRAVSEVGMGLFLSTVTTVLAFIPMAFVTGMMGPYMGPIPFFVPAALIISLFFAYTLIPWLASAVCRKHAASQERSGRRHEAGSRFLAFYEKRMTALLASPGRRKVLLALTGILFIAALSLPALTAVRFRMLPKADRDHMYVYLDLDRGASLERTAEAASAAASALVKQPDVTSVQTFTGRGPILDFNGMFKDAGARSASHQTTLRVNLLPKDRRDPSSEALAVAIRPVLREALKPWSDAVFQIIEDPPGPPVQSTFLLKVKGTNAELLETIARDLRARLTQIRGIADLDISILEPHEKYVVDVNRPRAAAARISTARIASVLNTLFEGAVIGVYHDDANREQEYIVLKFPRGMRDTIEDLSDIYLTNEMGNAVPVKDFLTIRKERDAPVVLGDNRRETVYISGEMENRSVTYAAIDALAMLAGYRPGQAKLAEFSLFGGSWRMPSGESFTLELGGEWELTLEVFRDLGLAMGVAVLLVYGVMVVQFRSYRIPLLIMATIPLSLIGVLPGFALLFLAGKVYFSATSMIGVIALSGIVVNNAIILVEYIQHLQARGGKDLIQILIEACKVRLQPILLTSLTTILGTLMIAADPVWSGLAWSVVFGLSLSTVLTMVIFPVLYIQFMGRKPA